MDVLSSRGRGLLYFLIFISLCKVVIVDDCFFAPPSALRDRSICEGKIVSRKDIWRCWGNHSVKIREADRPICSNNQFIKNCIRTCDVGRFIPTIRTTIRPTTRTVQTTITTPIRVTSTSVTSSRTTPLTTKVTITRLTTPETTRSSEVPEQTTISRIISSIKTLITELTTEPATSGEHATKSTKGTRTTGTTASQSTTEGEESSPYISSEITKTTRSGGSKHDKNETTVTDDGGVTEETKQTGDTDESNTGGTRRKLLSARLIYTDLPQSNPLIDDEGPVGNSQHGVLMKGISHYGKSSSNYLIYHLVTDENWDYIVNPTSCSTTKYNIRFNGEEGIEEEENPGTMLLTKCISDPTYPVPISVEIENSNTGFRSVVKLTQNHLDHECSTFTDLIPRIQFTQEFIDDPTTNGYLICRNGTVYDLERSVADGVPDCTMVYTHFTFSPCDKGQIASVCKIINYKEKDGKGKLTYEVDVEEEVMISTLHSTAKQLCKGVCSKELQAEDFILLTCQGLSSYKIIDKKIDSDCYFIEYQYIGGIAGQVCRTFRKSWIFWWIVCWWFFGICITTLAIWLMAAAIAAVWRLTNLVTGLKPTGGDICGHCNCVIKYDQEMELHVGCEKGYCPYCRTTFSSSQDLTRHCFDCTEKGVHEEKIKKKVSEESRSRSKLRFIFMFMTRWSFIQAVFWLIMTGMILYLITPVFGISIDEYYRSEKEDEITHYSPVDYFDQIDEITKMCGTSCFSKSGRCSCPEVEMERSKRQLGISKHIPRIKDLEEFVPDPKGFVRINSTFTISESVGAVSLEVTSTKVSGNKLFVSGESIAELPLEARTGIIWKIEADESKETKSVGLSIFEYTQKYTLVHKHWIVNRKIKDKTGMICTGPCEESCGCKNQGCVFRNWPDDRGPGCNPYWCLNVGGCTCCALWSTIDTTSNMMYRLVESKYLETSAVICVSLDSDEKMCRLVTDGSRFSVENFDFQIGRVRGEPERLPLRILLGYELKGGHINLDDPVSAYLNPEICEPTTCSHGVIGDSVIYEEFPIYQDGIHNRFHQPITNWNGVSMDRTCGAFRDVKCHFSGVVYDIDSQFKSLTNRTEKISDSFAVFAISSSTLKVKPKSGGGKIQVVAKGKNIKLERGFINPVISHLSISRCRGCFSCHSGFQCEVKCSLKEPESFMMHFESTSEGISANSQGFPISQSISVVNLTMYTSEIPNSIGITIKETGDHSETDDVILTPIANRIMDSSFLVSSGGSVVYGEENKSIWDNIWSGISSFFKLGWGLVTWAFSGFWQFLVIMIGIMLIFIALKSNRSGGIAMMMKRKWKSRPKLDSEELKRRIRDFKMKAKVQGERFQESFRDLKKRVTNKRINEDPERAEFLNEMM